MTKTGKRQNVEWGVAGPAVPKGGPASRRPFAAARELVGEAFRASAFLRVGGVLLCVFAVFGAMLGSVDRGDPPAETVRMPSLVKAPAPALAPRSEPHVGKQVLAWWLMPAVGLAQGFADGEPQTPAELCRHLAEMGYSQAEWAKSELFKGEWECSSPLEERDKQSRSFVVLRGANEASFGRLMLKLASPDDGGREPLIAKAEEAVQAFAQAGGLVLSPDALPLLSQWRPGRTWTSHGTFSIVAEANGPGMRVVSMVVAPRLPRPAAVDCRKDCRDRFAFLATRAVKARRVEPRADASGANAQGEATGIDRPGQPRQ